MKRLSIVFVAATLLLSGCVQKMGKEGHIKPFDVQPKSPPAGTVSQTRYSEPTLTGMALLRRGRERYEIYCSVCHGLSGYGDGMVVRRGFSAPPSYHTDRLRQAPDSHFFDVMTHGYGAMYSYDDKVSESDRRAIIAYIRALQLSQNASLAGDLHGKIPREISP